MTSTSWALRALAAAAVLMLAACGTSEGDRSRVAVWELADPASVDVSSASLDVLVTRVTCSNGVTGDVTEVRVDYSPTEITLTIEVAPLPGGAYNCQGNDAVPITVSLDEPLRNRSLVDGNCDRPPASGTTFCEPDGTRWASDAADRPAP